MKHDKMAFIHIPKTAGTYVLEYLNPILNNFGYKSHFLDLPKDSLRRLDTHKGFDWTDEELLAIASDPYPTQWVHNHSPNWSEHVFREFKKRGWFTFTFARHPGDQICSLYFFSKDRYGLYNEWFLDDFVRTRLEGEDICWHLPKYWREIDFVREFSVDSFEVFMRDIFGLIDMPRITVNGSTNRGYRHYCEIGAISPQTQRLLEQSEQYRWYLEIKKLG